MNSFQFIVDVVFTNNTPLGLVLVSLITAITLVAAGMAITHRRRYSTNETNYLRLIVTKLASLKTPPPAAPREGTENKDTPAATKMRVLVSAAELASAVPPSSIIGDRLHTIALLRQSQTKVNLAALQQISRAKEASRTTLRFPGIAANLVLLIGLLGTFAGIAIVIRQLGIGIATSNGYLDSFSSAFDGMYTKFSTTLVGTAGAIVLTLLNFRLAQAQELLFEKLDRFTVSELLPATIPAIEDETLLEQIMERLDQSFARIEGIITESARTADRIGALQTAFSEIIANIRKQTRTEGPDRMQNLLGHVASVIEQISVVNGSLQAVPAALAETNKSLEKTLSRATYERPHTELDRFLREPYTTLIGGFAIAVVVLLAWIALK
jgi:hypothetical protein